MKDSAAELFIYIVTISGQDKNIMISEQKHKTRYVEIENCMETSVSIWPQKRSFTQFLMIFY